MLKYILYFLFVCFCLQSLSAQPSGSYTTKKTVSGKAKKYYEEGMTCNRRNENEKALKAFEKALSQDASFIDAQLQWAAVNYAMEDFVAAETGFEKVMDIDPLYNTKVIYTLGLSEMKLGKYEEAALHFQQYLDTEPRNSTLKEKAELARQRATFIDKAIRQPVPFNPENLGENINTDDWEYFPSLTADGETMIYTTRRYNQEDFFISHKKDGVWQKGQPIEDINTIDNEGAQSISADGKLMVFTACQRKDGYGGCDLYFTEVKNGRWTAARNMGNSINSPYSEKQPALSADGNTVFFTSSRGGGIGELDIWMSTRDPEGNWDKPQNLGSVINTPGNESYPFLHSDGTTLYFASEGHPGMGGYDLFYAKMQSDGSWGEAVNLGYPINTEGEESTLIVSLDGKTAYFASDRDNQAEDNGKAMSTDIFSFELYEAARPQPVNYVKAIVFDAETKKRLSAQLEFVNLGSEKLQAKSQTDDDGEFLVCLPAGSDYSLNVSKENYLFHSENFALSKGATLDKPYLLEIGLQPIPVSSPDEIKMAESKPVILRNVFFDTGSAALRRESYTELNRLKQLLEDHAGLSIRINGHTDNVGADDANLLLSEQRAQAVYDYLVEKGIAAGRLAYKGYGETMPIDSNDSEAGRQNNRRTEFVVTAAGG